MTDKALEALQRRRDRLALIDASRGNWSLVEEWYAGSRPLVAECFPQHLEALDSLVVPTWHHSPRIIDLYEYDPVRKAESDAEDRAENDRIAAETRDKVLAHLDAIAEVAPLHTLRDAKSHGFWQWILDTLAGRSGFIRAVAFWVVLAAAAITVIWAVWSMTR